MLIGVVLLVMRSQLTNQLHLYGNNCLDIGYDCNDTEADHYKNNQIDMRTGARQRIQHQYLSSIAWQWQWQ